MMLNQERAPQQSTWKKKLCCRIATSVVLYCFYALLVFGDIWLFIAYKRETEKPGNMKIFYWLKTTVKTCILTAAQIIIPFTLVFPNVNKLFSLLGWLVCTGVTVGFRVSDVKLRKIWIHRAKPITTDIIACVLLPLCLVLIIWIREKNNGSSSKTNSSENAGSNGLKKKCISTKTVLVLSIIVLSIFCDTVFHWTDLDHDDHVELWYLHAIRIIAVVILTIFVCIINRKAVPSEREKVLYVVVYNSMQVVFNDLSFILFIMLSRIKLMEQNGKDVDRWKYLFFGIYSIFYQVVIKNVFQYLLMKKIKMNSLKDHMLLFPCIFYNSYAKSMFIYTEPHISHPLQWIFYAIIAFADIALFFMSINNYWNRIWEKIVNGSASIERWSPDCIRSLLTEPWGKFVQWVNSLLDDETTGETLRLFDQEDSQIPNRYGAIDAPVSQTRSRKWKGIYSCEHNSFDWCLISRTNNTNDTIEKNQ